MNVEQAVFKDGLFQDWFATNSTDYTTHRFMLPYEAKEQKDAS